MSKEGQPHTFRASAEAAAIDPLHDQHSLRRQLPVHVRHEDAVQGAVQGLEPRAVVRLLPVV